MLAYVATGLFAIALILDLANVRVGPLTASVFIATGLICVSLHLAGVGVRAVDTPRRRR